MNHILTIAGPKGGSGKSVTALNLSASMGLYRKRVLLVDCDPLGTVTQWTCTQKTKTNVDLTSVMKGRACLGDAVSQTRLESVDILPAGMGLFPVSLNLSRAAANEKILRLMLDDIRKDYDFIVLDAPSSWGFLSIAAMTAADCIVAAMQGPDGWIKDFYLLLKSVQYIQKAHNSRVKVSGISLNRCGDGGHGQIRADADKYARIKELLYTNRIPFDGAVDEAAAQKTPLTLYDVNAPAAKAYLGLAREIILSLN